MSTMSFEEAEFAKGTTRYWWLFLITGVLWLWVTLIILRLNLDTVYAIAILFGFVAIGAGITEFLAAGLASGGWRWAHVLLGIIFIAAGIVAFFRPQGTFVALASIVGWVLLFMGIFTIVVALMGRGSEHWWLLLLLGIAQILLAFWAVGYFRGSAILLVIWVATMTLLRGIHDIVTAFRLRSFGRALERGPLGT
jgi:uncharacterized membrane protein HdeD (DUF308 family)